MSTPRSRVFGAVAAAYAEHRPLYPPDAVAWGLAPIVDRLSPQVLDLAAGTGQVSRSLPASAQVTAVEPDPAMLAELRTRLPRVRAVEGTAEAIPLPDSSVDAVPVGTAWHWFDPPRALDEIARVLRPGGVLVLLVNGADADVDWVSGYHAAAERGRPVPSQRGDDTPVPPHAAFATTEHGGSGTTSRPPSTACSRTWPRTRGRWSASLPTGRPRSGGSAPTSKPDRRPRKGSSRCRW